MSNRVRVALLVGLIVACAIGFAGCVATPKPESLYWPTEAWRTSTPEQQGIDSEALGQALDVIKEKGLPIHSLLIIRHGYIVLEAYFYPYDGRTLHSWASVTKSITSTLVGLAIDHEYIKGTGQRVIDFFPEYGNVLPDAKKSIAVEHLLTMTAGLDCGYRPGEIEALEMQRSEDFVAAVFNLPMRTKPGSEFSYCSGATHLLSAVLTRATGVSALDFGRLLLFEPLGIRDVIWPADPQGITYGWTDLRMHPRDMAKIGYLYLHEGRWRGWQILSPGWVRQSANRRVNVPKGDADYGYGWWIGPRNLIGMYTAAGRGGQRVLVWPGADLVVVVNGAGLDPGLLAPLLLASLKPDRTLPENEPAFRRLTDKIASAARPPQPVPPPGLPKRAREVSGRVYMFEPNLLDIKRFSLHFKGREEAALDLRLGKDALKLAVGLDGNYRFSTPDPAGPTLAVRGQWSGSDEFFIDYAEADGVNHFRVAFRFEADKVTMHIEDLTGLFPTQLIRGVARY
jgi:CubicO group peptidase (beta-lactamase class C family)